jgi:hypothetical protein
MSNINEETNKKGFQGDSVEKKELLKKQSEVNLETDKFKGKNALDKLKPFLSMIIDEVAVFALSMLLFIIVDFIMKNTVYYTFSDRSAGLLMIFIITNILYFGIAENLKGQDTLGRIATKIEISRK